MPFDIGVERLGQFHTESGLEDLQGFGGLQAVANALRVDVAHGISTREVAERQEAFGVNHIPEKPPKSFLSYLKDAFEDFTIRLLCACAVISILIAVIFQRDEELSWVEGVAILVTVLIVCNIQALQDWSKERSFRKLNADVQRLSIPVLRDGVVSEVLRYDIVVGDVIEIAVGDILEADGILIKGEDVEVDESALTGEPEDIKKNAADAPFVFSGTSVKNGSGRFLATAVGINSQNGKITALVRGQKVKKASDQGPAKDDKAAVAPEAESGKVLSPDNVMISVEEKEEDDDDDDEDETSVLKQKLNIMVGRITYYAFGAAGIAIVVMLARYVIEDHIMQTQPWRWDHDPNRILEAFLTGIVIVVVAVPEGLPLAVTLALSLSMNRMQADNNLVKHMDATETMGSATAICSDKTGTLTQNKMTVVRAYLGDREFVGEHSVERSCGKLLAQSKAMCPEFQEAICENICATRAQGTEIKWDPATNNWEQKGNKTDCALLAFSRDLGVECEEFRARPELQTTDRNGQRMFGLKMYPFSSSRKRAGLAVPRTSDPAGPCRLYVKGASEIVLKLCAQAAHTDGRVEELTNERRNTIFDEVVEKFAGQAMRTIGLAYRDFEVAPDWDAEIPDDESLALTGLATKTFEVETKLVFLGVMGIHDPLREGVPEAVMMCNRAGVDVRMVTGDHKATAVAIAKECGILRRGVDYRDCPGEPLSNENVALTGEEFRRKVIVKGQIDQEAFDEVWPHLRVLARSSPEDKHTLVSGIMASRLFETERGKELGVFPDRQVVAVTGDGTNDAPALRKADVGFAMKIAGTRVAQDAADILLLDDNFASVVKACMWGRNVYDSIVKFLQFQLTVNFSAVIICIIGAIVVKQAPLGVVQMLWVNLIMDSLGALALAYEAPTEALLNRKPYGRSQGLIAFEMVATILIHTVYQVTVLLIILFCGAGPQPPSGLTHEELEAWEYERGGLLSIETGIGRDGAPTEHYTVIFNAFVFMQLFNWINCRKVHFEWNAFEGITRNLPFCAIWLTCLGVQILVTQIGAAFSDAGTFTAFQTRALSGELWVLCIVLGVFSLGLQLVVVAVGQVIKPWFVKGDGDGESSAGKLGMHLPHGLMPGGDKTRVTKAPGLASLSRTTHGASPAAVPPPQRWAGAFTSSQANRYIVQDGK